MSDIAQTARHEWNHPNAVRNNRRMHGTGNRSTHKRANIKLNQAERLFHRKLFRKGFLRFPDHPSRFDFHNVDLPGYIEDRCDSFVPY
jgi:hypothetical protein